ncbi:MAG TPA: hypothetical protein VGM81_13295 [Burkholderiaceae bacterium]|jgi:hypothetical protein
MSETPSQLSRSWRVGIRCCTLTVMRPAGGLPFSSHVTWAPNAPKSLTTEEWAAYRRGRDLAVAGISKELGVLPLIVEV